MKEHAPIGTLICDTPPGAIAILSCQHPLSAEQMDRLRAQWNEAMSAGKVVVLDAGITVSYAGFHGWPDWEHCAA